jgi:hypothetical protein
MLLVVDALYPKGLCLIASDIHVYKDLPSLISITNPFQPEHWPALPLCTSTACCSRFSLSTDLILIRSQNHDTGLVYHWQLAHLSI